MVGVVNTSVTDAGLHEMHAAGVRGIRFNLALVGAASLEMLEPLSRRVDALGWHCPVDELQTVWAISAEIMTKNRPVLPDRPWCIPTDGKIKTNWESGDIELEKFGVQDDPDSNLTQLEK